jgi:hypothetical protein
MAAPIPLLLAAAACAEWFVTSRPIKLIAKFLKLEPEPLETAVRGLAAPFTYHGCLQSALEKADFRPDLIPQRIHLARLEHQLSNLILQSDRAEHRIQHLSKQEGGCDYRDMFEAEKYSNRLQQQSVRLLKDIQKAQLQLEKAASAPPQTAVASQAQPASPSHDSAQPPANVSANPTSLESISKRAALAEASVSEAASQAADSEAAQSSPPNQHGLSLPISPPPSDEEFLHCIIRNRERIKNTPAKDRETLMVRLIEEHRTKTSPRAA